MKTETTKRKRKKAAAKISKDDLDFLLAEIKRLTERVNDLENRMWGINP